MFKTSAMVSETLKGVKSCVEVTAEQKGIFDVYSHSCEYKETKRQ